MTTTFSARAVDDVVLERYTYGPEPAGAGAMHAHDAYQWCLCLGAPGLYEFRDRREPIAPGTLTLVAPGVAHAAHDPEERRGPATCLVAYVPVETAARLGAPALPRPDAARLFAGIWQEPEPLAFDTYLQALHGTAAQRAGREPRAVRIAREHLHARVVDEVRLAELATLAGLSPGHLVRVFTRVTGLPPHRYHTALRLERAKRLLLGGDATVGEIAVAVGFHDHAHFTRTFGRWVGVAPARYRRHAKIVQDAAA